MEWSWRFKRSSNWWKRTDVDTEDFESQDKEDSIIKDTARIKREIEEFEEKGYNYFKHCEWRIS
jgi:hypothetical protein